MCEFRPSVQVLHCEGGIGPQSQVMGKGQPMGQLKKLFFGGWGILGISDALMRG